MSFDAVSAARQRHESRLSAREKGRAVIRACARHHECCGAAHQPMRKSLCAGCTGKLCCRACQGNDACDKDDVKPTRPKLQTYKEHNLPGRARPGCWPYTHNLERSGLRPGFRSRTVPGYFTKPRHASQRPSWWKLPLSPTPRHLSLLPGLGSGDGDVAADLRPHSFVPYFHFDLAAQVPAKVAG